MGFLDRKSLLAKEPFQMEQVDLGNGDFIYVRQMSGKERDHFEQSLLKEKLDSKGQLTGYERNLENFRAKLVIATACDATGEPLLSPSDVDVLSKNRTGLTLEKIATVAQKLNNITEQDKENLTKNSDSGQADNSNSDFAGN